MTDVTPGNAMDPKEIRAKADELRDALRLNAEDRRRISIELWRLRTIQCQHPNAQVRNITWNCPDCGRSGLSSGTKTPWKR